MIDDSLKMLILSDGRATVDARRFSIADLHELAILAGACKSPSITVTKADGVSMGDKMLIESVSNGHLRFSVER